MDLILNCQFKVTLTRFEPEVNNSFDYKENQKIELNL